MRALFVLKVCRKTTGKPVSLEIQVAWPLHLWYTAPLQLHETFCEQAITRETKPHTPARIRRPSAINTMMMNNNMSARARGDQNRTTDDSFGDTALQSSARKDDSRSVTTTLSEQLHAELPPRPIYWQWYAAAPPPPSRASTSHHRIGMNATQNRACFVFSTLSRK